MFLWVRFMMLPFLTWDLKQFPKRNPPNRRKKERKNNNLKMSKKAFLGCQVVISTRKSKKKLC